MFMDNTASLNEVKIARDRQKSGLLYKLWSSDWGKIFSKNLSKWDVLDTYSGNGIFFCNAWLYNRFFNHFCTWHCVLEHLSGGACWWLTSTCENFFREKSAGGTSVQWRHNYYGRPPEGSAPNLLPTAPEHHQTGDLDHFKCHIKIDAPLQSNVCSALILCPRWLIQLVGLVQ